MVPPMTTEGTPASPVRAHIKRMEAEGIDVTAPSIVGLVRYAERLRSAIDHGASTMRAVAENTDGTYLAGD